MITTLLVVDVLLAIALLVLGLLVLVKNTKLFLNRMFFVFTLSIGLWIISNYFSNDHSLTVEQVTWANHLTFFFPGITMISLWVFVGVLTGSPFYKKYRLALLPASFILTCLALSPWVVQGVQEQGDVYGITFGVLSPLYVAGLLTPIISVITILLTAIKRSRTADRLKYQTIFWSVIGAISVNLTTNLGVPLLNGSFALTNLGPISIILIVGGLFYGIARHQLFDIRAVVARSLGYVLSLVALGLLYGVVAFSLLDLLLADDITLTGKQQLGFTILAVILTLAFQGLRNFFDHLTRRIFYKDGYDPQVFLDQFNKSLVSSLGIDNLLTNSAHAIVDSLKLNACYFIVEDANIGQFRLAGLRKNDLTVTELRQLHRELSAQNESMLVTDYIERQPALKRLLNTKDIGLVSILHANSPHEPILGYLILGLKKNGNPYTSQDTRLIEIISSELVIAIQNNLRFEQIQNFNATLQEKIEDATKRLRQTNAKLKALDQTKDDFISMASHQLRTPLTSVKGYVSMVLDGDAGDITPLQRKLLNQSFVSSQRMVYLISDLLNVSRLRTGKFVIEPTPTDLSKVIEDEVEQLTETANSRSLKLVFNKPAHFPALMLDETKIRQVIMNFMDNAIYYTPSGGTITINLVEKAQSVEFTVVDNGIGVPKHEQHHLFSKFYRAHNAKRARPDGTGLGLFMAKKVIVAQGGALIFKSQEKKGSTFGFTFAKNRLAVPAKSEPAATA